MYVGRVCNSQSPGLSGAVVRDFFCLLELPKELLK